MSGETIVTTPWWERYSADIATEKTHRVEVFFRSLAPSQGSHDRRLRVLERLDEITKTDLLDVYDINVVGEGMCLCEDCTQTRIARHMHDTLTDLREGGEPDVEPQGFAERPVNSTVTHESYRLLVPPEASLAVYVGDSLRGVFPAEVNGTSVTIDEYLDALATVESTQFSARAQA